MELYNQFIQNLIQYQFKINSLISSTIKETNNEDFFFSSFLVLVIAFIYGLVHAIGPGHGKALVAFYFSTNKENYYEAIKVGYLISIIHAISALSLTFTIYFLLKSMFRQNFDYYSNLFMQISASFIVLIGLYLIISSYLNKNENEKKIDTKRSKYALAFSSGIVPCPGVMTIVLFCLVLKKYTLAIFAAITMSIGMGLTISLVGILSILLNKKTNKAFEKKAFILEILGGFLILFLGITLFLINS